MANQDCGRPVKITGREEKYAAKIKDSGRITKIWISPMIIWVSCLPENFEGQWA